MKAQDANPFSGSAATVAEHERRLREVADAIERLARARGVEPSAVSRATFFAVPDATEDRKFAWRYWGPAKALATRGEAPAPPLDAIPPGHRVRGVSTLVGEDGRVKGQWVKTAAVSEDPVDAIARAAATLSPHVPVRVDTIDPPSGTLDPDLLAVYPLGDPHIGLLAWGRESGANFDLEIAERTMVAAVRDLVDRGRGAEGALIVNLGDFFHFDNDAHHTTRGDHALDVDGRTARVLEIGLRIFVSLIDASLERHAFVRVDNVAGNHDRYTSIMLGIALRAHYRNEARVQIDVDPAPRHYHTHGAVLLGTTHGDRERSADLAAIMAAERPSEWGTTRHRYWLCGHVHHSQVKEQRGAIVETFRTLAARDAWHAGAGYVSGRDLRRIVYHRRHGAVSREIVSIDRVMEIAGLS